MDNMIYSYDEFIKFNTYNEINSELKDKLNSLILLINNNINNKKSGNLKYNFSSSFNKSNKNSKSNNKNIVINNKNNTWRIKKTVFKKEIVLQTEKYENNINSLLNKLAPLNFDTISIKIQSEFTNLINDSELDKSEIEICITNIINNIFTKAVMQIIYCPYYVKLINILNNDYDIFNLINLKCKEYKNLILQQTYNKNKDLSANEKYDEFCKEVKNKVFKEGYSQFIGELFNNNIVTNDIIIEYIVFFIGNLETIFESDINDINDIIDDIEYNIICCIKLLETAKIDYNSIKDYLTVFFNISTKKIPKRLKFKLLDIKDNINI